MADFPGRYKRPWSVLGDFGASVTRSPTVEFASVAYAGDYFSKVILHAPIGLYNAGCAEHRQQNSDPDKNGLAPREVHRGSRFKKLRGLSRGVVLSWDVVAAELHYACGLVAGQACAQSIERILL